MLATALYEEPPNFQMRTGFDLRRIVEDQVSELLIQKKKYELFACLKIKKEKVSKLTYPNSPIT